MKKTYILILAIMAFMMTSFIGNATGDSKTDNMTDEETYYVVYRDQNGRIIFNDQYYEDYTFDVNFPTFHTDSIHSNIAWNECHDGSGRSYVTGDKLAPLSANLNVYSVISEGHFVRFNSDGGTILQDQFVLVGGKATAPATINKSGYSFVSWVIEGTSQVFDFNTVIQKEVHLIATWAPATTNYTVLIWLENPEHNGDATIADYTLAGSFTKSGTIGGDVSFTNADLSDNVVQANIMSNTSPHNFQIFFCDDKYGGNALTFTNNSIQEINENGGIANDGSTTLNVYFRRFVAQFTIDDENKFGDGRFKETHPIRHQESIASWINRYNITVKESLHKQLTEGLYDYELEYSRITKINGSTIESRGWGPDLHYTDVMDFYEIYNTQKKKSFVDAMTLYFDLVYKQKGNILFSSYSYVETIESARNNREINFNNYNESNFYISFEYRTRRAGEWDGAIPGGLEGFTYYFLQSKSDDGVYGYIRDGSGRQYYGTPQYWGESKYLSRQCLPQRLRLYYTRKKYILRLNTNADIVISPINIIYNDILSYYKEDVAYTDETGKHEMIPDQTTYTDTEGIVWLFKGWYDNSALVGEPIDFATTTMTMPAKEISLFGKWDRKNIKVTLDANRGKVEGQDKVVQNILSGDTPVKPANPVPPTGTSFSCWALDNIYYDFKKPITDDTEIVAKYYMPDQGFHVTHNLGEGTGTAPIDDNEYLYGANPIVLAPSPDMKAPTLKTFSHWQDSDGNEYYPGDELYITENMTLTAQYGTTRLKIRRNGMSDNHNAVYSIYWKASADADDGTYVKRFTISVNQIQDNVSGMSYAERTIILPSSGYYKVVEDSWSWAYEPDSEPTAIPSSGTQHGSNWVSNTVNGGQTVIFTFNGASKEIYDVPKNDEDIIRNKLE